MIHGCGKIRKISANMSKNIKIVITCHETGWPIYHTYVNGDVWDSRESFGARCVPKELIADAISTIMQDPELNFGRDGFEVEFDRNDYCDSDE